MNVISRKTLVAFSARHPDAEEALKTWYHVCKKAKWNNFNDMNRAYPSADIVGDDRVVFNIKGNTYRLVARFSFRYKVIQIKWIGTHAEYDRINVLKV